ncbi:MAG: MCE family protein [Herminiimonas sp.]|nr:MCE family protein [Herminiimonas sp.]
MENKSHALLAGVFTLVLAVIAVLLALWFNRDRVEWVPYEIATKLSVPGLNPQAAVRYRGLDVGRVDKIIFDPAAPGQILIHISIKPDTPVTQSTYATLGYQGVTGIAYIQLDDDGKKPVRVTSSKKQVARIELRPSLFDELQTKGLAILEQTEALTKRFNTLLEPANQKAMLAAFDNISRAAIAIEAIPRQLEPTLSKLPALTAQTQQTLASVSELSKNASQLTKNLNQIANGLSVPGGPLNTFTTSAERIGSVANQIELDIVPLARDTQSTLRNLNRTLDNFNQRPQSILFGTSRPAPGPGEAGFAAPK